MGEAQVAVFDLFGLFSLFSFLGIVVDIGRSIVMCIVGFVAIGSGFLF
ncbi:hypothetical protein FVER14953_21300 [Fusarium verticillioides]|nr:hypothetical protein FVER14953_21300 [Fusarium verticillioides]